MERCAQTGLLGADLEDALAGLRRDRALRRVIDQVECTLEVRPLRSVFEALARSIVYQQLSGKAAASIFARVKAQLGGRLSAARLLEQSTEDLRGCGLSGAKTRALQDLAARTRRRELPSVAKLETMTNEAIVDALTVVRGVGPWSVQMLLMFRMGRPDILPATDLGIRKGAARLMKQDALPSPDEVLTRGKRWSPHRTLASWYLWRLAE